MRAPGGPVWGAWRVNSRQQRHKVRLRGLVSDAAVRARAPERMNSPLEPHEVRLRGLATGISGE